MLMARLIEYGFKTHAVNSKLVWTDQSHSPTPELQRVAELEAHNEALQRKVDMYREV